MDNQILRIEDAALPYAYWLSSIPGVGRKTINYLLSRIDSPKQLYNMSEKELRSFLTQQQIKRGLPERIVSSRENKDVHEEYQKLTEKRIYFTCLGHCNYPKRLYNISDAPYGLYYRGKLPVQESPSAAIIGARSCSEYGRHMAERFGKEFAIAGVQVISGMARGIDGIGQKEALAFGGYSLGVMGCGVDICYPQENRELYDMLCAYGGICSEYPPGMMPKNTLFPPRNRIISALSDIVLVIEAKNRSGTLITVDMALEQGKEVYALPGRVGDALSEGCNRLIQQGAGIVISPSELIRTLMESAILPVGMSSRKELNISSKIKSDAESRIKSNIEPNTKSHISTNTTFKNLSDIQLEILDILSDMPQSAEIIKERLLSKYRCTVQIPELMTQLMKLSLCGLARQVSNSYFVKG